LALGEEKEIYIEDPKWDSRLSGKVFHNVFQKDCYLGFLLAFWGFMALLDVVGGTNLLSVVPKIVGGLWCMKVEFVPISLIG